VDNQEAVSASFVLLTVQSTNGLLWVQAISRLRNCAIVKWHRVGMI